MKPLQPHQPEWLRLKTQKEDPEWTIPSIDEGVQQVVFTYTAAGCGNHFGKQFVTIHASGTQAYSVTQQLHS